MASELFRSHGYDAVGIADVIQAAGMTQGGFYKHLANKEALACEAWSPGFANVDASWTPSQGQATGDDGPSIEAIVEYYLSAQRPGDRCPMQGHGEGCSAKPGSRSIPCRLWGRHWGALSYFRHKGRRKHGRGSSETFLRCIGGPKYAWTCIRRGRLGSVHQACGWRGRQVVRPHEPGAN